jgi:hypothetical protein
MSDDLQRAIAAIRSGDRETGKRLLAEVIRHDPRNEAAWLWMSAVIDSDEHRRTCLERVLTINPSNEIARQGLAKLSLSMSRPLGDQAVPATLVFQQADDSKAQMDKREDNITSGGTKKLLTAIFVILVLIFLGVIGALPSVWTLEREELWSSGGGGRDCIYEKVGDYSVKMVKIELRGACPYYRIGYPP